MRFELERIAMCTSQLFPAKFSGHSQTSTPLINVLVKAFALSNSSSAAALPSASLGSIAVSSASP